MPPKASKRRAALEAFSKRVNKTEVVLPEVPDPETGGPMVFWIRDLKTGDVFAFLNEMREGGGQGPALINLIATMLVEEDGITPLDDTGELVDVIANIPMDAFTRLSRVVQLKINEGMKIMNNAPVEEEKPTLEVVDSTRPVKSQPTQEITAAPDSEPEPGNASGGRQANS